MKAAHVTSETSCLVNKDDNTENSKRMLKLHNSQFYKNCWSGFTKRRTDGIRLEVVIAVIYIDMQYMSVTGSS